MTTETKTDNRLELSPSVRNAVILIVAARTRTFGGGGVSEGNPIAAALADRPPMFAAGVDVGEVVDLVVGALNRLATSER
jgi:hypothetical protein